MPLILGTNSIKGGYEVANSLRFNSGDTPELTRTPSGAGNRKTLTFSTWIKRAKLGSHVSHLFSAGTDTSGNDRRYAFYIYNDILYQDRYGSSNALTQVFRDPSAWYHLVIAIDTTQSTATDRVKVYINGGSANTFGSALFNQNDDTPFNSTLKNNVGKSAITSETSFDGYMTEVVSIDGQALTPTSFGEFDEDTGIWKPIDVSDLTFGTNGFHLDFENSGSLGADVSGNSNNFTVNNLTAIDQTTDTCTNNFATLNPLQTDHSGNTSFSEGNNKFQATTGDWVGTASTQGTNTGKWYAEFKLSTLTTSSFIGIATDDYMSDRGVTDYVGFTSGLSNYAYAKYFTGVSDSNEGYIRDQSQTYNSYGSNTGGSTGDIIGVALDLDNNKAYWSVNGTWENSADPSAGTNGFSIGAGTYQFGVWGYQATIEANFGNPSFSISSGNSDGNGYGNFEYAVPSGYYALNSKNLAEFG